MPVDSIRQSSCNVEVAPPPPDNLGEAISNLKIHDHQDHEETTKAGSYPDRPDAPDCLYYMRTGSCGYGINCRYNHPPLSSQGAQFKEDLPERIGQPDCGYYLKTGTCKYGTTCKYHHPKDRNGGGSVSFNTLGLPMRQDEKPCPHYMRYGDCKFGTACKFHHPQPPSRKPGFSALGSSGTSAVVSSFPYVGGVPTWSFARAYAVQDPRMQSSQGYFPVVLPFPFGGSGWSTYTTGNANHALSPGGSEMSRKEGDVNLPQRPDQPECRYFMNNGTCKYGSECKYHHPKERLAPPFSGMVGPHGLPSRPGQVVCPSYSASGFCKFGSACRFDHPYVGYSYGYNFCVPQYPSFDWGYYAGARLPPDGPTGGAQHAQNSGMESPDAVNPSTPQHSSDASSNQC